MVIPLQEPFKPPPIPAPHVELAVTEPLLIVIFLQEPLMPPPIPAPAPSPLLLAFKIPVVVFEALIIIS